MLRRLALLFSGLLTLCAAAGAHIGSPDIYLDAKAGPYPLFVTIRPPAVIPGVAELEVRAASGGITGIRAVPMPMAGPGAKFAPIPDKLAISKEDPQLFTGSLWMMQPGSWQVRLTVEGTRGIGTISVPVPSAALLTKRMRFGLGSLLSVLGLFLVASLVAMVGASVREARLEPGDAPVPARVRAGRLAMLIALMLVLAAVWFGNRWWNSEARSYGEDVYKPLQMGASLSNSHLLILKLADPGWLADAGRRSIFARSVDDFVPDHGHLMHLYAIRQPGLDVVYHLHPEMTDPGVFTLQLPSMPRGEYKLYADVVHANGFPETLVSSLTLPSRVDGRLLVGDDADGHGSPWNEVTVTSTQFTLPDGYKMIWLPVSGGLHAKRPVLFRFRLDKPDGTAPQNMAFYMGMLGHAAFVKTDGTVFAHVHPTGSVSMAAFMLAQKQNSAGMEGMDGMDMGEQASSALPNEVTIPYGFPSAGGYRIFVQMKHGQTVETGIFDAIVQN
jgi:hypothetical protein